MPTTIEAEVTSVALEHHLVSQFTSLVAVDVTPPRRPGSCPRPWLLPVNLPAGWGTKRSGARCRRPRRRAICWLSRRWSWPPSPWRWVSEAGRENRGPGCSRHGTARRSPSAAARARCGSRPRRCWRSSCSSAPGRRPAKPRDRVKPWPWADTWPVARLSVPRLGERWIVLAGASGRTLAFGPGHMDGTALPGERGNVVLAGHRDTQFATLRATALGDELVVETPAHGSSATGSTVSKSSTSAAGGGDGRRRDGLTLVTCWPFGAIVPGGAVALRGDRRPRERHAPIVPSAWHQGLSPRYPETESDDDSRTERPAELVSVHLSSRCARIGEWFSTSPAAGWSATRTSRPRVCGRYHALAWPLRATRSEVGGFRADGALAFLASAPLSAWACRRSPAGWCWSSSRTVPTPSRPAIANARRSVRPATRSARNARRALPSCPGWP